MIVIQHLFFLNIPSVRLKLQLLLPDPLPKLYKSYIKLGVGNYISPLAEISITNERSKKGAIGILWQAFFNQTGKLSLKMAKNVFAGYMDNDVHFSDRNSSEKVFLKVQWISFRKQDMPMVMIHKYCDYYPAKKDIRLTL